MVMHMPPNKYENFDLLIDHTAAGNHAHVIYSLDGEGDAPFQLPFSARELENTLGLIGGVIRGFILIDKDNGPTHPPLTPESFGRQLYNALFGSSPLGDRLRA